MSSLATYRRRILREQGRLNRVRGWRAVPGLGQKKLVPVLKALRSWAILVNHDDVDPFIFEPGQEKPGTKPGHRWQRRQDRRNAAKRGGAK